jgi:hypothetical protein
MYVFWPAELTAFIRNNYCRKFDEEGDLVDEGSKSTLNSTSDSGDSSEKDDVVDDRRFGTSVSVDV